LHCECDFNDCLGKGIYMMGQKWGQFVGDVKFELVKRGIVSWKNLSPITHAEVYFTLLGKHPHLNRFVRDWPVGMVARRVLNAKTWNNKANEGSSTSNHSRINLEISNPSPAKASSNKTTAIKPLSTKQLPPSKGTKRRRATVGFAEEENTENDDESEGDEDMVEITSLVEKSNLPCESDTCDNLRDTKFGKGWKKHCKECLENSKPIGKRAKKPSKRVQEVQGDLLESQRTDALKAKTRQGKVGMKDNSKQLGIDIDNMIPQKRRHGQPFKKLKASKPELKRPSASKRCTTTASRKDKGKRKVMEEDSEDGPLEEDSNEEADDESDVE